MPRRLGSNTGCNVTQELPQLLPFKGSFIPKAISEWTRKTEIPYTGKPGPPAGPASSHAGRRSSSRRRRARFPRSGSLSGPSRGLHRAPPSTHSRLRPREPRRRSPGAARATRRRRARRRASESELLLAIVGEATIGLDPGEEGHHGAVVRAVRGVALRVEDEEAAVVVASPAVAAYVLGIGAESRDLESRG